MKVLFLTPPKWHYIEASSNRTVDKGRESRPMLGLLYVASWLEQHRPDHQIKFVDASLWPEETARTELEAIVKSFLPDVVAMSAMTFTILDVIGAAKLVKQIVPSARVVVGGWHATYYPRETLRQDGIDYIIHGEGERAFAELCDILQAGQGQDVASLTSVAGLAFVRPDGEIVVNPPGELVMDLDSLVPPNYELTDFRRYGHVLGKNAVTLALQSSRGCPFACQFCDIRRSRFRQRSSQSVVDEIERWRKMGVRSFFFVDDNFAINRNWTIATCSQIASRRLDIEFKISARVDVVDQEMLQALARAGCTRINYGVESSDQANLDFLGKGTTIRQIERAFSMTRRAGLQSFAYMIIGFPGQTEGQMLHELEFLHRIRADFANFTLLSAYPKTELYKNLLTAGVLKSDFWQAFAEHPDPNFVMPLVSDRYSSQHLREIQSKMTRLFYLDPRFILRTVGSIRSWTQFKNYAAMARRIVGL